MAPRKNLKMSKTVFKKGSCAVVIIVPNCCVNYFTNNLIGPCSISKSIYNHMTRCQRSANNKSTLPERLLWNQKLPELAQLLNCHLAKWDLQFQQIWGTFLLKYSTLFYLIIPSDHCVWNPDIIVFGDFRLSRVSGFLLDTSFDLCY